jgi:hypothetical protein
MKRKGEKKMVSKWHIFEFINHWKDKRFALGANIASESWPGTTETYLALHLGFWQLYIGFRLRTKEVKQCR